MIGLAENLCEGKKNMNKFIFIEIHSEFRTLRNNRTNQKQKTEDLFGMSLFMKNNRRMQDP